LPVGVSTSPHPADTTDTITTAIHILIIAGPFPYQKYNHL
jgi:hypothetical protein